MVVVDVIKCGTASGMNTSLQKENKASSTQFFQPLLTPKHPFSTEIEHLKGRQPTGNQFPTIDTPSNTASPTHIDRGSIRDDLDNGDIEIQNFSSPQVRL